MVTNLNKKLILIAGVVFLAACGGVSETGHDLEYYEYASMDDQGEELVTGGGRLADREAGEGESNLREADNDGGRIFSQIGGSSNGESAPLLNGEWVLCQGSNSKIMDFGPSSGSDYLRYDASFDPGFALGECASAPTLGIPNLEHSGSYVIGQEVRVNGGQNRMYEIDFDILRDNGIETRYALYRRLGEYFWLVGYNNTDPNGRPTSVNFGIFWISRDVR